MLGQRGMVRKGRMEDAEDFGKLVAVSGEVLRALWGDKTEVLHAYLFSKDNNLYGRSHAVFVEMNGKVAGMLLGYGKSAEARERENTRRLMIDFLKLEYYFRFFQLMKVYRAMGGLSDQEYLISNIAVYPEFRKRGLGSLLVEEGRKEALDAGNKKLTLDVLKDNAAAISFYKGLGFQVERERPVFRIAKDRFEFYKMSVSIE